MHKLLAPSMIVVVALTGCGLDGSDDAEENEQAEQTQPAPAPAPAAVTTAVRPLKTRHD